MDLAPSAPKPGKHQRQKRVLPSRPRRGGPGVGTCEVDMMILDVLKRKMENEPLIPLDTPFLLTTEPVSGCSSSAVHFEVNTLANERYFNRPEVRQSFREQATIQIPEFKKLSECPIEGSRFRPRRTGDSTTDSSDAAYEKRHRKFELHEKRLRLREKENLKYEQYKLKERIEQLRAMDGAAFMSLSSPSFPFGGSPGKEDEVYEKTESDDLSEIQATFHAEGERRKREMLEAALSLEERYRTLLPTPMMRKAAAQSRGNLSAEPAEFPTSEVRETGFQGEEGESEVEASDVEEKPVETLKFKIKVPASLSKSVISHSAASLFQSGVNKSRMSLPTSIGQQDGGKVPSFSRTPLSAHSAELFDATLVSREVFSIQRQAQGDTSVISFHPTSSTPAFLSDTSFSHTEMMVLEPSDLMSHTAERSSCADSAQSSGENGTEGESMSKRRHKRFKPTTAPPVSYNEAPRRRKGMYTYTRPNGEVGRTTSVLYLSAVRAFSGKKSRKAPRHAFGVNVPRSLAEERDYELAKDYFRTTETREIGLNNTEETQEDAQGSQNLKITSGQEEDSHCLDNET